MAEDITERIRELMQELNYSASAFADVIGIQRPAISHIMSGRNRPSLDVVLKILKTFPELNPQWLLTGEGTMKQLNLFGEEEDISENKDITSNNIEKSSENTAPTAPHPSEVVTAQYSSPPVSTTPAPPEPAPKERITAPVIAENHKTIENQTINQESFETKPEQRSYISPPENQVNQFLSGPTPEVPKQKTVNEIVDMASAFGAGKKIEKIVIFYSDKTFAAYHPE